MEIVPAQDKIEDTISKIPLELSEENLNHAIEVNNIEDFYLVLEALTPEQTNQFIEHFKKNKEKEKEAKIGKIVFASKTKNEIISEIKPEIITHMKERIKETESKLREARKSGKEVDIETIMLMRAPLKVKMFEATGEKKDFLRIKKIVDDVDFKVTLILKPEALPLKDNN